MTRTYLQYFSTGPFRLHDGFHDSPGLYQYTLACYIPVRGVYGECVAIVYLIKPEIHPPVVYVLNIPPVMCLALEYRFEFDKQV